MRSFSVLLFTFIFYVPLGIRAEVVDGSAQLSAVLNSSCTAEVPSIINSPDFTAILQEHPVDTDKICACAMTIVLGDKKLRDYLNTEQQTLMQRLVSAQFLAYASLRISGAIFTCIAPEIDVSLSKSVLPQ